MAVNTGRDCHMFQVAESLQHLLHAISLHIATQISLHELRICTCTSSMNFSNILCRLWTHHYSPDRSAWPRLRSGGLLSPPLTKSMWKRGQVLVGPASFYCLYPFPGGTGLKLLIILAGLHTVVDLKTGENCLEG